MKKVNVILCAVMLGTFVQSCKKDATQSTTYSVRMTDAPGPYTAVYVDVQGVELTGSGSKTVTMNVKKGVYNLLDFSNGVDTLIASGSLDVTTVSQVRLILGTNNSVTVNGTSYPLSTPSADQSGLKLQVHQALQAGVEYKLLLDFDANTSIVNEGSGSYKLKPVIRTIDVAISGSIRGKISTAGVLATVTASSGASYSSNVNAAGDFLLMGIPPGTYTVSIVPAAPLNVVTQTNVTVVVGVTTNLGTIAL
jgi:uncharacterized protein involved in high-affinity Fe2+ transport